LISGLVSSKTQAQIQQEYIVRQLNSLNRKIGCEHLSISASISQIHPLLSLREAYTQAIKFLDKRYFLGRGTVLCADNSQEGVISKNSKNMAQYSGDILKTVIDQDEAELITTLRKFKEELKNDEGLYSNIKEAIIHTVEKINHYLLEINVDENCLDIIALQKEISNFAFLEDIIPWWEKLLLKTMYFVKKVRKDVKSPRIAKAIDFIQAHLFEDISAAAVAEITGITPNYFSAQFKKEIGLSFKSYINQERLGAAAYLLGYTNEPVYLIAEKTGYHDYIYFSQVFKQKHGYSPSEYRARFQIVENHI
jgi:two-component system response regulator YesN